jgi:hypothetical protein
MGQIIDINFAQTHVTDQDFVSFGRLPYVRQIILTSTNITDDGLIHIPHMHRLYIVYLRDTGITSGAVALLRQAPIIGSLDLSETAVDDMAIPDLIAMPRLRYLTVENTKITVSGLEQLHRARPDIHILTERGPIGGKENGTGRIPRS